jgi:hypothetical protein
LKNLVYILLIAFVSINIYAQERCGTDLLWEFESQQNPEIVQKRVLMEEAISNYVKKRNTEEVQYTIPVVFHIIYNNNTQQISNTQILSQLQVLNDDFGRNNADANNTPTDFVSLASDTEINFCLAKRDPQNDTTTGITYTYTDISSFSLYDIRIFHDSLGGKNIWDPQKYLNIYVCDLTNALGFSSFPGGNPVKDGVVIDYQNFGTNGTVIPPYNLGRTATHEVGHWFNLFHIWGNGNCSSDMVDDTPTQETENYGCSVHPSPSCSNSGDMFQNYMDYSNDDCMNLFTEGQKTRMHATINTERIEITNSFACSLPFEDIGITENIFPYDSQVICGSEIDITTSITNFTDNNISRFKVYYSIDNQAFQQYEWSGNLVANSSQEIQIGNTFLMPGIHQLTIYTDMPNGFRDLNTTNDTLNIEFEVKDGNEINLTIQSDNYGEEVSWQITDDFGDVQFEENNILSNQENTYQLCLDNNICYTFTIFDQESDGICCNFGNGYVQLNNQFFSGEYNDQLQLDLCQVISVENIYENNIEVFPNPSSGYIHIQSIDIINSIKIYNIHGKLLDTYIFNTETVHLSLESLEKGLYLLQLNTNKENSIKKIILK